MDLSLDLLLNDIATCQDRQLILDRLNQCKQSSSISAVDLLAGLVERIMEPGRAPEYISNFVFALGLFSTLTAAWSSIAEKQMPSITTALLACIHSDQLTNGLKWALLSSCFRLLTIPKSEYSLKLHGDLLLLVLPILQNHADSDKDEDIVQIKAIRYIDQVAGFLPELLCECSISAEIFACIFELLIATPDKPEQNRCAARNVAKFIELSISDFVHPGLGLIEPRWFTDSTDDDRDVSEPQRLALEKRLLSFKTYDVSAAFNSARRWCDSDPDAHVVLGYLGSLAHAQGNDGNHVLPIYEYCHDTILKSISSPHIYRKKALRNHVAEWLTLFGNLISFLPSASLGAAQETLQNLFRTIESKNLLFASIRMSLCRCFSRYLLASASLPVSDLQSMIVFCLDNVIDPVLASDCVFVARDHPEFLTTIVGRVTSLILHALEDRHEQAVNGSLEAAGRVICYLHNLHRDSCSKVFNHINDMLDQHPSPIALQAAVRIITHGANDAEEIIRFMTKCVELALLRYGFYDTDADDIDSDSQLQTASLLALKAIICDDSVVNSQLIPNMADSLEDMFQELVLSPCIFEDDLQIRLLALEVIREVAERADTLPDCHRILHLLETSTKDSDIGKFLDPVSIQHLIGVLSAKTT